MEETDYSPTSMQNFSTMKRTMWGGNTFMWGCMPIVSSSFMKGAHQLISVFVVTPAESANCCFVIAFIKSSNYYILLLHSRKSLAYVQE